MELLRFGSKGTLRILYIYIIVYIFRVYVAFLLFKDDNWNVQIDF